jgi:hypothetical protein
MAIIVDGSVEQRSNASSRSALTHAVALPRAAAPLPETVQSLGDCGCSVAEQH